MIDTINQRLLEWADVMKGGITPTKTKNILYDVARYRCIIAQSKGATMSEQRVSEQITETEQAILQLPTDMQSLTKICYLSGKTLQQVALRLGCSRSHLYKRLHRLHLALAAQLPQQ